MERWNNLGRYQKVVLILSIVMALGFSIAYLIYKGNAFAYFGALALCIWNVIAILFADELF